MLKDRDGNYIRVGLTITATHRPEILERTLKSFCDNLFEEHMREGMHVYINIDPVGSKENRHQEVLEVLKKFFPNGIRNQPKIAHFPTAFQWCWTVASWSDSKFIFHLEEDWELLRKYDFQEMVQIMIDNPDVAHLRFSIFKATEDTCKNWTYFYKWNGKFFECPKDIAGTIGWCGHPSLNSSKFVRSVVRYLSPKHNTEKQIKGHHQEIGPILNNWRFGSFIEQNSLPNIRDIGRQWMADHGYKKKGKNKEWFVEWEEGKCKQFI